MINIDPPADIAALDLADPLRHCRDQFILPEGIIYLDGNSLGPATYSGLAALHQAAHQEWAQGLIRSWNEAGWFDLPSRLGGRLARLIGAEADEVVVTDSTSINLYKALHAACAARPGRAAVVAESDSFPTDIYVSEGVVATLSGHHLRLAAPDGSGGATLEDLIDEDTAVVLVNHVDYRSGRLRDMAALTALAHARGALVVWDLCHSAGALPVTLNACAADFAVGCSYKYLNGGPGAPAFIFAARRHHATLRQPLSGWWGHARPFAFETGFNADPGARRLLVGTQPMLSLRALDGALDAWDEIDMAIVRAKSIALTDLFIVEVERLAAGHGLRLATPRESSQRGSQVSFAHGHAYPLMQALIAQGVIGDFRAPDRVRFGFAPLYLSYAEVWRTAQIIGEVLTSGVWCEARFAQRAAVT